MGGDYIADQQGKFTAEVLCTESDEIEMIEFYGLEPGEEIELIIWEGKER